MFHWAMRPMVPSCPRQMHRSLIPGSSPTRTPSAESTFGASFRRAAFLAAVFRVIFFFAMVALTNFGFDIQFTPKAFDIVAQGQRRSRATLGCGCQAYANPEGVPQWRRVVQPLQGCELSLFVTQGGAQRLRRFADPGLWCEDPVGVK